MSLLEELDLARHVYRDCLEAGMRWNRAAVVVLRQLAESLHIWLLRKAALGRGVILDVDFVGGIKLKDQPRQIYVAHCSVEGKP